MKQNDESPRPKKRKRSREDRSPHPHPALRLPLPPTPSPSFLGARVFDFLAPVPLGAGITPIQAHTQHCKLISLGYSHRKSGCQVLFPPQFLNSLGPPRPAAAHWASLYKLPVLILQFPFTLSSMPRACQQAEVGGRLWRPARPLDSCLWPPLCFPLTIREPRLDTVSVLTC